MQNVKDKFFAAGLEVLKELGPSKLSIDRVCKKTKLSKGAFFHYFKSKDQFLIEVIEQIFSAWNEKVKEASAVKKKEAFLSTYISSCLNESPQMQEDNKAFGRIILQAAFSSEAIKKMIRNYYVQLFKALEKSHKDPYGAMVYIFALDGMMLANTMDIFPFKKKGAELMMQAMESKVKEQGK